jgi:trans-2,3-dihydro-3-hydroxyanthranilate isomerase
MTLPYTVVDVFTETPFAGNQLGVFTDAGKLAPEQMQKLAREMSFSECTFVVGQGARGPRVRIFTPEVEIPFAGHPTLGTAAVLVAASGKTDGEIVLELGVGEVPVTVQETSYGARAELLAPAAAALPCAIGAAELAAAVGLTTADLDASLPPAIWSTGNAFIYVAARDTAAVARARLRLLENPAGWPIGIVLFTLDDNRPPESAKRGGEEVPSRGEAKNAHARVFIPGSIIFEDPATGSANAPLVAMLHAAGRIGEGEVLVTRQGIEMGRPSRLEARMIRDAAGVLRPAVAGGVVRVASGAFTI